jgi:hypothetical protein
MVFLTAGFPSKMLHVLIFLISPLRATYPVYVIFLHLIILIFVEDCELRELLDALYPFYSHV